MSKQQEFVEKRLNAHRAATTNLAQDPLVQAAFAMRAIDEQVMARLKDRRVALIPHEKRDRRSPSIMGRRQAD